MTMSSFYLQDLPYADIPKLLKVYSDLWAAVPNSYATHCLDEERATLAKFTDFYLPDPHLFFRTHVPGHFTGSALIVNRQLNRVLLTLHAKMHQWFQLGGHADGNQNIAEVALKEAQEESGLTDFQFVDITSIKLGAAVLCPFDLDCHSIPPLSKEARHNHYDVSFLLVADDAAALHITPESKDLRWFALEEAMEHVSERSLQRQFQKLHSLKIAQAAWY